MRRQRAIMGLAAAVALGVSACGGEGNDDDSGERAGTGQESGEDEARTSAATADEAEETSTAPRVEDEGDEDTAAGGPGSLEDPYTLADTVEIGAWSLVFEEVTLDATDAVHQYNEISMGPPEGKQYLVAVVEATNTTDSPVPVAAHLGFRAVDAAGEVVADPLEVGGDMLDVCLYENSFLDVESIDAGESHPVSTCLSVPSDGAEELLLQVTAGAYASNPPVHVSLADAEGQTEAVRGSSRDPFALGESYDLEGWEFTVHGAEIGGDLTYNGEPVEEEPHPGTSWVILDIEARNVEAEDPRPFSDVIPTILAEDGNAYGGQVLGEVCSFFHDDNLHDQEIPTGDSARGLYCIPVPDSLLDGELLVMMTDSMTTPDVKRRHVALDS